MHLFSTNGFLRSYKHENFLLLKRTANRNRSRTSRNFTATTTSTRNDKRPLRFGLRRNRAGAVLIDGKLTSTDCMLAAQIDGHDVITVEWFNKPELHPIQAAFVATGAMQSVLNTSDDTWNMGIA